jgi:hypothetical protein
MEKGQNRSFKGKKDNKGCVDSPAYISWKFLKIFKEVFHSSQSLETKSWNGLILETDAMAKFLIYYPTFSKEAFMTTEL